MKAEGGSLAIFSRTMDIIRVESASELWMVGSGNNPRPIKTRLFYGLI